MKKLYAFTLTALTMLGLSAQSPSPICGTQVYHFENTAEVASSVYLSIGNYSANTIFVEVQSATADAVNNLIVNSTTPGGVPSAVDSSDPGKYRMTYSWSTASPAPTAADINVLWSKRGFGGNWQWIAAAGTYNVTIADTCGAFTPPPGPAAGDVTFSVDMSGNPDPYTNVYVSGSFNGWCGNCNQLTDPNMDGIYTGTVAAIGPGAIEYKFTTDDWNDQEYFSPGGSCTVTNGGFTNRALTIDGDTTLGTVCWESCFACGSGPQAGDVTFSVDMSGNPDPYTNVYVSGSFNGWCGDCNQLTDPDMDSIYTGTVASIGPGVIEYKFTTDNWNDQENLTPGSPCTVTNFGFTNRALDIDGDTTLTEVCWDFCGTCAYSPTTKMVTFQVNMSNYTDTITTVTVNGDFNGWCGVCNPMNDQGNGLWTLTIPLQADSIDYKFTIGNWTAQELFAGGESCTKTKSGFTNRYARLLSDTTLAEVCWNDCGPCCSGLLSPMATAPGNYSIDLTWNSSGASTYWVYFREAGDTSWTRVISNDTSKTILNRQPGDYEYFVSEVGGTNASCEGTVTVTCDDYNYNVNVFQIVDQTGGKANVFAIDGGRRRWDIALLNDGDTTWSTNRWSNFFRNLQPGTYTTLVRDAYDCYSSQVDTFTIDAVDSTIIPMLSVIDRPFGASAGTLRPIWSVSDTTNIDRYQIRVKDMTGGGLGTLYNTYIVVGSSATQYDVTGLPPARYRIDVRGRVNGSFADGVYSNYRERIVTAPSAKNDGSGVGINDELANSYPNPTSGILHVAAPQGSEVVLMDINGRIMGAQTVDGAEVSFDLSSMAQGVYLVRVQTNDKVYTERIVKE